VVAPHQWFKTQHGLHLASGKAMTQVHAALGVGLVDEALVDESAAEAKPEKEKVLAA
jgi:predicted lipoprotein with Yx(FWY)xxD motif